MKVLVIGYGSIGKRHIDNLSTLSNIEILVCTKRKYDNFLKIRKCKKIESLNECIKMKPDAAIICNETSLHLKTATKLAKSRIHIFVEKPLSNSVSGIHNLEKIVKKHKLITHVGCVMRFHPCLKEIKKVLDTKQLGRIMSVRVENGSFLPDWHQYENYRNSYAAKKKLGGGVVLTCIHEIDYLCWFFNKVKEVNSFLGKMSDLDIEVEDVASALLRFEKDMIAEIHLDYFQKPAVRGGRIIGTKGKIDWDFNSNLVKIYDYNKKRWSEKIKSREFNKNEMYLDEIKYFLNCIKNNKQSINNIRKGAEVLQVALAIKKSNRCKKVVRV